MTLEEFAKINNVDRTRKTKDKNKLAEQQKKFIEKHKCSECGNIMDFIVGTNVCACNNPKCKGKKVTYEDGTVVYKPIYEVLKDKTSEIGNTIFG